MRILIASFGGGGLVNSIGRMGCGMHSLFQNRVSPCEHSVELSIAQLEEGTLGEHLAAYRGVMHVEFPVVINAYSF
jgi:hypothetical protein